MLFTWHSIPNLFWHIRSVMNLLWNSGRHWGVHQTACSVAHHRLRHFCTYFQLLWNLALFRSRWSEQCNRAVCLAVDSDFDCEDTISLPRCGDLLDLIGQFELVMWSLDWSLLCIYTMLLEQEIGILLSPLLVLLLSCCCSFVGCLLIGGLSCCHQFSLSMRVCLRYCEFEFGNFRLCLKVINECVSL